MFFSELGNRFAIFLNLDMTQPAIVVNAMSGSITSTDTLTASSSGNITSTGTLTASSSGNIFSGVSFSNITVQHTGRGGWPERHKRRVWWYFRLIKVYGHFRTPFNDDAAFKAGAAAKYWSEHELEVLRRVQTDLAELYNNRFIEYKKMRAKEQGFEMPEIENTNKYIMRPS